VKFTEDESIIITDKSGNEIHLDTTGSNINITAPETMNLNCKNLNINVGENMTTSVGQNITTSAGADIVERTETSDNRTEISDEKTFRQSKSSESFYEEVGISSTKENMTLQSAKTVITNSGEYGSSH
jgi:type VI secretion system secreted protein VgrG